MAVSRLYIQREELKHLVDTSGLDEGRKQRLRGLIPHMLPSELLRLKLSLLSMLEIEAAQETIDSIIKTRKEPENEETLWANVHETFMKKVEWVEERTKRAMGE